MNTARTMAWRIDRKNSHRQVLSGLARRGWPLVKCFGVLVVLLAGGRMAMAQSDVATPPVEQILGKFVQALGGHAALENVTSMMFTGALNVTGLKEPGKTTEYFKYPDHFAFVAEIPGYGTVRTVCDGKTAWSVDPKGAVTEITGPQLSDMRRRADIHWNLKLKEFYPGMKVTGREKLEGKDAWVVEATTDGWTFRWYFDAGSGLLVRFDTDTHTADGNSSVLIGDYRDVGKVRFAYTASMKSGNGGWSRQLEQVKFNVPIEDAVFTKPSPATNPAPSK